MRLALMQENIDDLQIGKMCESLKATLQIILTGKPLNDLLYLFQGLRIGTFTSYAIISTFQESL